MKIIFYNPITKQMKEQFKNLVVPKRTSQEAGGMIQRLDGAQANQRIRDVQTNRKSPEATEFTHRRYLPAY